ncbi:MAG: ABC transporter permease [Chloroflexota bacterium]
MSALYIAQVNLVRMLRDRTGLFFVFLLPIVLIVVLGTMYGGRTAPRLGIVSADAGLLGDELVTSITDGDMELEIKAFTDAADLRNAVETGTIELGLVVPPGYDGTLRSGGTATITLLSQPGRQMALEQGITAAVAAQSGRIRAARLAEARNGIGFDAALGTATAAEAGLTGVAVTVEDVGKRLFPAGIGMFSLGAQSQLVLFMFLTSLTAATQLILTRQLGVSKRMLSTPTSVGTILVGEMLGRFGVAMIQGLFIVLLSAFVFGVDWGDPLGASALIVTFALVGTGAAMVVGAFSHNPDQAGTVGVFAGMLLGALGGAMIPIEIFGEPMRTIAQVTPHYWAIAGFRGLVFDRATIVAIAPQIGVLGAMALALLAVATWRLRRQLTG